MKKTLEKFTQLIKFYIDDMLLRGSSHLIGMLAVISAIFIIFWSFLTWQLEISDHENYADLFWALMMRALTPDYFDVDTSSYAFALIALIMTIFGIFILSTLISFINTIIEAKINAASNGAQNFPFENHFIIIGWSDRVKTILDELFIQNSTVFCNKVLILLPPDTTHIPAHIFKSISANKNVRIFYRTRDLLMDSTYHNANLRNAKSVLIIGDDSQFQANFRLKILLSIRRHLEDIQDRDPDIIIEVRDQNNLELFNLASLGKATLVSLEDIPARLIVQTIQQSSLPSIYEELFSFEGSEIYITTPYHKEYKDLFDGGPVSFSILKNLSKTASLFGIINSKGQLLIAPNSSYNVHLEDQLIFVAADDKAFNPEFFHSKNYINRKLSDSPVVNIIDRQNIELPLNILLLGFSKKHELIVDTILKSPILVNTLTLALPEEPHLNNIVELYQGKSDKVSVFRGKTDTKEFIEKLDISSFDNIIISHTGVDSIEDEDSSTMRSILYIKDFLLNNISKPHITMEMIVGRHRDIVTFEDTSDFVVSENISSKVLAQYIDNPERRIVIGELLKLGSADIVLKPVSRSSDHDIVDYGVLCKLLMEKENVVIGWRYNEQGIHITKLNPLHDEKIPIGATNIAAIVVTSN